MNVAFLTVMPSPYTQDLFQAMSATEGFARGCSTWRWRRRIRIGARCRCPTMQPSCPGFGCRSWAARLHVNRGVLRAIAAEKPDVVVVAGYAGLTNQAVMRWLHWRRIPWVFWGEVPGMRRRRGIGAALRRLAQRPAMRWADGIAAIGSRAVEAYQRLSGGRCPVANIPYCCDMAPFLAIDREEKPSRRSGCDFCTADS